MIDKDIVKQALESIRETCKESRGCLKCAISHTCPITAQIPSEWTDKECDELIWFYPGFKTKEDAIDAVKKVLWKLNDEIYGQISAKDEFEEE